VKRSGTWAEVGLISIQAGQDGQIKAEFMIRHPSGRGVDFTLYVDGEPVGGGGVMGSSILGFPVADSKDIEFDINPEHDHTSSISGTSPGSYSDYCGETPAATPPGMGATARSLIFRASLGTHRCARTALSAARTEIK